MFLYVIQADGSCKVGMSQDPQRRLRNLQAAHFGDLALVAVFDVGRRDAFVAERTAHQALAARFERSREWFKAPAADCCRAVEEAIRSAPDDMFDKRGNHVPPPGVRVVPDPDKGAMIAHVLEAADRLIQQSKPRRHAASAP